MNPIYKKYKERFIQISGRNKSLYLKGIVKKYSYDIGFIMENRTDTDDFLDFLWHRRRTFSLINDKVIAKMVKQATKGDLNAEVARFDSGENQDLLSYVDSNEEKIQKAKGKLTQALIRQIADLKYLKREVEEVEKETGLYDLYIGYPFVFGRLSQDIELKAPLLLFPVHIQIEKDEVTLTLTPNQPVMLNKALILAYTNERNLKSDKLIQEFDPLAEDSFSTVWDVVDYLNDNGFKLRYSKRKSLLPFDALNCVPQDGFEIKNMAVMGKFPLANAIYNDYLAMEKDSLTTPAIDALLSGKTQKQRRTKRTRNNAKDSYYPINDLDYAQENALSVINKQDNVVIYGPPGTGKSQTIVNIISDALCKGKRVLVVSQKRAALDVVFSRLGKLNAKAMLMPDPEKEKAKFFERVRAMHFANAQVRTLNEQERYKNVELDINREIATLESISDTLFTKTKFGLNLQEMYALSYNIGKDSKDYSLYKKLLKTPIIERKYDELYNDVKLINDKNLTEFYLAQIALYKDNPMVAHLLPNIELHELKEAQTLVSNILANMPAPFDISKYPHGRYLTTFYLENTASDRKSISRIADIVTSTEHPSLSGWLRASCFPVLWPLYPILKGKFNSYKEDVKIDLNIAMKALVDYENEYKLLEKVLDSAGFALAISGLINGNPYFLNKLREALNNYVKIRDMKNALDALSPSVKEILAFAYQNSDDMVSANKAIISKIIPIRIYHEIISGDKYYEPYLTKIVTFDDLRQRILRLKEDQREISRRLASESFSDSYREHFNTAENSKDFLYEIQKQRGLKPVRLMFEYFDDYLLKLFPCWLLSPEVVSMVLPLKRDLFDLVVFDEASQIFIESALPAIYRGSKVVIAGDNKQLRPTAGFVKKYFGDYNFASDMDLSTQAALEVESLLDLATARYYPVHLTYHYRSDSAELIDFSNASFYENKLQIAPNVTKNPTRPPIERIKVKGLWQDRHNHEEAVQVVKLIKSIFRERDMNETIGVVTFNIEQKEYIEDLLDAEADKNQTFRKQLFNEKNRVVDGKNVSLFVKNLENVQGEERDIIIFSVGYAKNDYDKVVAQFGSLSKEGGENRLNVAITRAKKKVYVVTSIEPEELDRSETTKNNGPKLLKKYLQYARAVSMRNTEEVKKILSTMHTSCDDDATIGAYEMQIKEELEKLGYDVDVNLGNTDYKLSLGVYDKELNSYVLGIECDYRAYHSSDSVLERDVYRFKFLESRGWKIIRVWSRDWWLSREKVLTDIVQEIERRRSYLFNKINSNK